MSLTVLHRPADLTHEWLEAALGREVTGFEATEEPGTCSTHVRLVVHVAGEREPMRVRAKLASAETFGRAEVDYYARDFAGLADAPLLRCHHAAADATRYHVLMDDVAVTHRDQFDVPPTQAYGLALADAIARLHAHRGAQPPPAPDAIERDLAKARAGLPAMLGAMRKDFTGAERDAAQALMERLPLLLRDRLADPVGFGWVHGDLNPGNVLVPRRGDRPLYLIDHQPFAGSSLVHWLLASDLAHALVVWWPIETRRACERPIVQRWHERLVERGCADFPLARAWADWRLCLLHGIAVPAARCAEPGAVTALRWLWEPQLRRVLAAAADHA